MQDSPRQEKEKELKENLGDSSLLVGVPVNSTTAPGCVSGMEVRGGNHLEPP